MPYKQNSELKYYCFDSFDNEKLVHGIFTRHGGVSPQPWASLNQGGTVGDERKNVIENRRIVFEAMNREVSSIFDVWQVHGKQVICAENPRPLESPHQKADAILTNKPSITLFMRFADCVPVLVHDPVKGVIGIIHAGWQGTVQKICAVTIQTMQKVYGSDPKDVRAGIGPSIGLESYEVGEVVIQAVRESFGDDSSRLLQKINGGVHLDLWEANRMSLQQAGVEQIEVSGICTASNVQDWYSHRKEAGKTGRFGALLGIK